jgi:hypothetical protein
MVSVPSDKRADDLGAAGKKRRSKGGDAPHDGPPAHRGKHGRDDAALDRGLADTFPASDPVSISPGSD